MKIKNMNISECLATFKEKFPLLEISDINTFLADLIKIPHLEFFLHPDLKISEKQLNLLENMLCRRANGEPIQYILEKAYFRDYELKVGEGVLIPRPETEILVDECIKILQHNKSPNICDMGTGSGAIAISCAIEIHNANVYAADISENALNFASENIKKYNLNKQITLLQSNLFDNFHNIKFNLIAANLPYVALEFYDSIDNEVKNFEPHSALFAENNGLQLIEICAEQAYSFLLPGGTVIFEISPEQEIKCLKILDSLGYVNSRTVYDLTNRARFCLAQVKSESI